MRLPKAIVNQITIFYLSMNLGISIAQCYRIKMVQCGRTKIFYDNMLLWIKRLLFIHTCENNQISKITAISVEITQTLAD